MFSQSFNQSEEPGSGFNLILLTLNMLKACCWVRVGLDHYLSAIRALQALFFLFIVSTSLPAVQGQGLDCNYAEPKFCGNLSIPYPFGMSPECGLPDYRISCKPNASYGAGDLAFLQIGTPSTPELQVLNFTTNTLVVNSTDLKAMPADCYHNYSVYGYAALELPMNGPFVFAMTNVFVVIGCNADGVCNADSITISCTTNCYNQFSMAFCNDYTCCTNGLPPGSRSIKLQGRGIYYTQFPKVCGFATVLDPDYFTPTKKGYPAAGHYGLSLSWALKSDQKCSVVKQSTDYACHEKATCLDAGDMKGYTCNCTEGYRGDGYKAGIGCQDIDECEDGTDGCENPPLGKCINTDGSYECKCTSGDGSGLPGTCPVPNNVLLPVLLGGLGGVALLGLCFLFIFFSRRAYRRRKDREDNFKRIGGDQLTSFLFSERELTKATKGFADDHVLGEGGFGKVYWGKLSKEQGGMKVAIKRAKTKAVEEQVAQIQSFVREILLLGKCKHKNVVQLLGCCVETSVPLLVYEYVEKGTLRDYLRPQSSDAYYQGRLVCPGTSLLWAWRLHIAVETAEAVGYLHNRSEPVFHLDMKSPNILIDSHYNPKVADFGLSCFLTSDATHITNLLPVGTFGYVDPEYYHSLRVTDKCDVYSFGVILLELISGTQVSQGPGLVLAHRFRTEVNMREEVAKQVKQLPGFIDTRLGTDRDVLGSIQSVAELARRCVALKGADRPSMQEVVKELRQIEAKNSGRPYVEGPLPNHDHHVGVQELYGNVNSNESEQASFLNYRGIPSDRFTSSSSLFTPPQLLSGGSTASSSGPQLTTVELGQLSKRRY